MAPSPELFARVAAAAAAPGGRPRLRATWALVAAVVLAVLGVGAGVDRLGHRRRRADVPRDGGPVRATVTASEATTAPRWRSPSPGCGRARRATLVAVDPTVTGTTPARGPPRRPGDGTWRAGPRWSADLSARWSCSGDGGRELARVTF